MKHILLFLLLPFNSFSQKASQYLVLKTNDTIFYRGTLEVDNDIVSRWRKIQADSITYAIREIRCAYFDHSFYYNCDGARLYKQVVNGKINVYAINESDTSTNDNGKIKGNVFIQKGSSGKPMLYNMKNFITMIKDDEPLFTEMKSLNRKSGGGKAMIASGIGVVGATVVVGGFIALLGSIFGDEDLSNDAVIAMAGGALVGGGLIAGGAVLKSGIKKMNLLPVYEYNAKRF